MLEPLFRATWTAAIDVHYSRSDVRDRSVRAKRGSGTAKAVLRCKNKETLVVKETAMKPIVLWLTGVPIMGIILLKVFGII